MSEKFALIIEDEADLATIFSEALKAGGFETEIIQELSPEGLPEETSAVADPETSE